MPQREPEYHLEKAAAHLNSDIASGAVVRVFWVRVSMRFASSRFSRWNCSTGVPAMQREGAHRSMHQPFPPCWRDEPRTNDGQPPPATLAATVSLRFLPQWHQRGRTNHRAERPVSAHLG